MPGRRNKFKKEKNNKKRSKSDNTDYSIEINKEVIYVPQEMENEKKESKFKFFEKSKDKKTDSLIEKLHELTNNIKKKSLEQQNNVEEDVEYLEKKTKEDLIKHSNDVKNLVLEKVTENANELKDLILFRKKINIKENLKEDLQHIKETLIEKIKDYVEDVNEEIIEKIKENVLEIKEIIFGKEEKKEGKGEEKKSKTFDNLLENLKSFTTKFEENKETVKENEPIVKMQEIIEKKEIIENKLLSLDENLKVIQQDQELILTWGIVKNSTKFINNKHIIITNIDKDDEIVINLAIHPKFGSHRSKYGIQGFNKYLMVDKQWNNILKIKISNNHLYLKNNSGSINFKINDRNFDIIKTNIKGAQWL